MTKRHLVNCANCKISALSMQININDTFFNIIKVNNYKFLEMCNIN